MNAMSIALKRLQADKLYLDKPYRLPLGIVPYIDKYIDDRKAENPEDEPADLDLLYNSFKGIYARKVLTWVVFIAAIVVALLADLEFVKFYCFTWYAITIGVAAPLIVTLVLLL